MISGTGDPANVGTPLPAALTANDLQDALSRLASDNGAELTQAELVDQIGLMERLKSGLAARQARLTARLATDRATAEAAAGVPSGQRGRGLAAEIALARRE